MITVDGLTPGIAYETQILLGNEDDNFEHPVLKENHLGPIRFRSIPDGWPIRIGVLGDASFGDDATQMFVRLMSEQHLDFVIHSGDIVYEIDGSDRQKVIPISFLNHLLPYYTKVVYIP